MLPACVRASSAFVGELHAAGLAAPADLHLRLHDDRIADAVGGRDGVVDGLGDLAGGDRDAVAGEQLLALVLEQIHATSPLARMRVRNLRGGFGRAPIERLLEPVGDRRRAAYPGVNTSATPCGFQLVDVGARR